MPDFSCNWSHTCAEGQSPGLSIVEEDEDSLVKLTEEVERMHLAQTPTLETKTRQNQLIRQQIKEKFGYWPKDEQTEAIRVLLYDREDIIVIAKTGFGKSIIFQALSIIEPNKKLVSLIIMPLNLLQEEQAAKINKIDGCNAVVLNQETRHDVKVRKGIGDGLYTHGKSKGVFLMGKRLKIVVSVFSGPETVVEDKFQKDVLRNPVFQAQIGLVAIDEFHLVEEWGSNFRPTFGFIGQLRQMLPFGTPFLGVTATLTPKLLEKVKEDMGFRKNVRMLRTTIDRPEIYIATDSFQHSEVSMLDLQYLLPQEAHTALCIPKTIIYMESKGQITQGVKLFHTWMSELAYAPESKRWVQPYHADLAIYDREEIAKRFGLPSNQCTECRIILATDSYGLGIDNPDVARVVQWGIPRSLCAIYQRAGRAMRNGSGTATFILLHPKWCLTGIRTSSSEDATEQQGNKTSKSRTRKTQDPVISDSNVEGKSDVESDKTESNDEDAPQSVSQRKRDKLPKDIIHFLNQGSCYRRASLAFFGDKTYSSVETAPTLNPCCSYCHPGLINRSRPLSKVEKQSGESEWRPWRVKQLEEWREEKCLKLFDNSICEVQPDLILPDKVLEAIALHWGKIVDVKTLWKYAGVWGEAELYMNEIIEIINRARTGNIKRHSAAMRELQNSREEKRKRRQSKIGESKDGNTEFEARRAIVVTSTATTVGTRGKSKSKRKAKITDRALATSSPVTTQCEAANIGEQGTVALTQEANKVTRQKLQAKSRRLEALQSSSRGKRSEEADTREASIIAKLNEEIRSDVTLIAGVLNGRASRYQRKRQATQRALGYPSLEEEKTSA